MAGEDWWGIMFMILHTYSTRKIIKILKILRINLFDLDSTPNSGSKNFTKYIQFLNDSILSYLNFLNYIILKYVGLMIWHCSNRKLMDGMLNNYTDEFYIF